MCSGEVNTAEVYKVVRLGEAHSFKSYHEYKTLAEGFMQLVGLCSPLEPTSIAEFAQTATCCYLNLLTCQDLVGPLTIPSEATNGIN